MAGKIKGITIEIGGDTTGLDKALRGVNSEIKETQSNLRDVEKALKLDPTNTELLAQKQRELAKAVEATSKKLDTLKEAQKQAMDQLERGEISQQQYDALTREIVKTEDALKRATEAQASFNATAEQAKAKLDGLSTAAGNVADKTKMLSAAGAGVVAAIGGLAIQSAAAADDLNTMAKQSGLSTDELQRMKYASDLVDVSLDNMVGAQSKLRRSMASNEDAFKQLGVSVKDSNGQMRDSSEVFYQTLQALSRIGNETERDQMAMQIFGKSADQLAGIIDDGGAALKAYGDEAEQLGLVLDESTLASMNELNDSIDKLKAQATGELAKAGASAIEALQPLLEDVIDAIGKILEFIGSLSPDLIKAITIIAGVVAAISPVSKVIAGITSALSSLIAIFPAIGAAFSAVSAFAAANPIVLIAAAVAALALLIITHWEEIKPVLEKIWQKVQDVAGKIKDFVLGAIEKIKGAFEAVKDFFAGIFTAIADGVKDKINTVIGWVNKAIEAINGFVEKINSSKLGQALGINIGTIGTIETLPLSGDGGALLSQNGRGSGSVSNYNTANTYNTYNQTSQQPLQVNMNIDGRTLASQMVQPMRAANAAAGGSNMR